MTAPAFFVESWCDRALVSHGTSRPYAVWPGPGVPALTRRAGVPASGDASSSELGVDAHRAGGAGDDARRHLLVVGVEVFHLLTGDLEDLVARELGDLGLVRLAGPLGDAGGLLDQLGGRRGLRHEGERAVLVDRDLDRDDVATLGLRRGVVGLDELPDVDAVLTEGRADGRGGGGLTGLDLQLDEAGDLLLGGHGCLPSSLWADAVGDDPVAHVENAKHFRRLLFFWVTRGRTTRAFGGPRGRRPAAAVSPRGLRSWRPGRRRARPGSPGRRSRRAP